MNTGTPMNTFAWLVKREYWENRGGFLWTPAIVAMLSRSVLKLLIG